MSLVGEHHLSGIALKAGESRTVLQLTAPQYQPAKLIDWKLGFPNYRLPMSKPPLLGKITVTIERQTGGTFANNGHIPARVSGSDRPNEHLLSRYRSVVTEEPESGDEIAKYEIDVLSGEITATDLRDKPIDVPPGSTIGFKIETEDNVAIDYLCAQHQE